MKFTQQLAMILLTAWCWAGMAHASVDEGQTGPRIVVENAANQAIAILEEKREIIRQNPDEIYGLVDDQILPHFDFDKMSYFVLGKVWKNATEQQKSNFQREFKHLLISTYATALLEYSSDDEIVYKDVSYSPKNKNIAIVSTEVRPKGATPVGVSYRMFRTDDTWKIYDVVIDGVSLVTNYRANFAGQVRSKGLDGLITSLSEHNQPKQSVAIQPASQKQ